MAESCRAPAVSMMFDRPPAVVQRIADVSPGQPEGLEASALSGSGGIGCHDCAVVVLHDQSLSSSLLQHLFLLIFPLLGDAAVVGGVGGRFAFSLHYRYF